MKTEQLTPKMRRQRKVLLALPLLVLPFLTLFFWALGGGKPDPAIAQASVKKGFDTNLPDAKIKDGSAMNKMSYYDQAALDSVKLKQQIKSDPYYHQHRDTDSLKRHPVALWNAIGNKDSLSKYNVSVGNGNNRKASEAQVYQKLAQLQTAIHQPAPVASLKKENAAALAETDELQRKLQGLNKSSADDPEMAQMNSMLEKVLDIQHPDRVNEQMRENSEKHLGQVFAVSSNLPNSPVGLLANSNGLDTNRYLNPVNSFYALEEQVTAEKVNAIPAVIHETETVVNGSVIKLRLTGPVFINGVLIPKDNFVFGVAALNGERLAVKINSIRYRQSLFPVSLSVYDMDGLEGIEIPGAISRDVAKESAASSVQNMGLTSFDPSFGAQAAGAGIEDAKTLFTRKVKLITVTVKAGYEVLLKDEKAKENTIK
jgi:conjugative transposon TraM protein